MSQNKSALDVSLNTYKVIFLAFLRKYLNMATCTSKSFWLYLCCNYQLLLCPASLLFHGGVDGYSVLLECTGDSTGESY